MNAPLPIPLQLERAYQLIHASQYHNAGLVLDALVRVDPQNVEAWKAYLMIFRSQNELDWLKDRILRTRELNKWDKMELLRTYQLLREQLQDVAHIKSPSLPFPPERNRQEYAQSSDIRLELIDMIDYPAPKTETLHNPAQPTTRRPNRRATYNPFSEAALWLFRKFTPLLPEKSESLVGNPDHKSALRSVATQILHSPQFMGWALLALFVLGVRITIAGSFMGYVFLAIFFVGGWQWLSAHTLSNPQQPRVYLHEQKDARLQIKETRSAARDSSQEKINDKHKK